MVKLNTKEVLQFLIIYQKKNAMGAKNKTIKDVEKFLNPLYKPGQPFVIYEKDYRWIRKVMTKIYPELKDPTILMSWKCEKVFLDTLQTKEKPKKLPCRWCGKTTGIIKFYINIGSENPEPWHPKCLKSLKKVSPK